MRIMQIAIVCCLGVLAQSLVAPLAGRAEPINRKDIISRLGEIEKLTDEARTALVRDVGQDLRQTMEMLLTKLSSQNEDFCVHNKSLHGRDKK